MNINIMNVKHKGMLRLINNMVDRMQLDLPKSDEFELVTFSENKYANSEFEFVIYNRNNKSYYLLSANSFMGSKYDTKPTCVKANSRLSGSTNISNVESFTVDQPRCMTISEVGEIHVYIPLLEMAPFNLYKKAIDIYSIAKISGVGYASNNEYQLRYVDVESNIINIGRNMAYEMNAISEYRSVPDFNFNIYTITYPCKTNVTCKDGIFTIYEDNKILSMSDRLGLPSVK
jgi:hypothetical protein